MAEATTAAGKTGDTLAFPDPKAPGWSREVLRSDIHTVSHANRRFCESLRRLGIGEEILFALKLSLEEALANAVKHGNQRDPSRTVVFRYLVGPGCVALTVADQGQGFAVTAVPDPTLDENLEVPHGRGIMLMRAYMDYVAYNAAGTQVSLMKLLP